MVSMHWTVAMPPSKVSRTLDRPRLVLMLCTKFVRSRTETVESARTPVSSGVVASSSTSGGPNEALVENLTCTLTVAEVDLHLFGERLHLWADCVELVAQGS